MKGFAKTIAEDVLGAMLVLGAILGPWVSGEKQPLWRGLTDGIWVICLGLGYFAIRAIVIVWSDIDKSPAGKEVESPLYLADGGKQRHLIREEAPSYFQLKLVTIGVVFFAVLATALFSVHTVAANRLRGNSSLPTTPAVQNSEPSLEEEKTIVESLMTEYRKTHAESATDEWINEQLKMRGYTFHVMTSYEGSVNPDPFHPPVLIDNHGKIDHVNLIGGGLENAAGGQASYISADLRPWFAFILKVNSGELRQETHRKIEDAIENKESRNRATPSRPAPSAVSESAGRG